MAKKKKREKGRAAEDYYKLKTDAVNRLVDEGAAPEVSDEEIGKYTSKRKLKLPLWLKVVLVKWWFGGAVCYFFLWGLGTYFAGLDLMVILALALGVATDLMVNRVVLMFVPQEEDCGRWVLIHSKKFWTVFLNVPYAGVLLFLVYQTYNVINTLLVGDTATAQTVPLAVEPVLFGLFYTGYDMLFVTMKNTLKKIFQDAVRRASGNGRD